MHCMMFVESSSLQSILIGVGLAMLGFFLTRFYYSMDEMKKDIKQILWRDAQREVEIKGLKENNDSLWHELNELKKFIFRKFENDL